MKKLQPSPKKESSLDYLPKSPDSGQKLATMDQYEAMVEDRPVKFNAEQVGFIEKAGQEYYCGNCFHYFTGAAAARAVCEIFRPEPEKSIQPESGCKFWTNGTDHPLLPKNDKSSD